MGTIGTGTEGNEQAAEMRPTDAWRIRHLEVHFENLGSVRIKDRLIESTSLSQDLVGRYVWTQPSAGELLQLSDPFGFPKVQDELKVTHIIDLDVAAAQEAAANAGVETPAAAEDGGEWRTKNYEVHFEDSGQFLRWLHIENGRIARVNPQASGLAEVNKWIGLVVLRFPVIGSQVWFQWPSGEGGVMLYKISQVKEYSEPASKFFTQSKSLLVEAVLEVSKLMMRVREQERETFARQFIASSACAEIMRQESDDVGLLSLMYGMLRARMTKLVLQDEAQQMAALFLMHTSADPKVVESSRQLLRGCDKRVTKAGIGRFSLTDFQQAGCPPEDLERLRLLISIAPTETQQQEGSAAHVG